MAKKKSDIYYLDPASLSVKKVRVSLRQRIFRWLRILFVGAFVFAVAFFISTYYIESPREKQLSKDLYVAESQYRYLCQRVDELEKVLGDIQNRDNNLYRLIFEAEPTHPQNALYQNYNEFSNNEIADAIINTSERIGGAAIAASRLAEALRDITDKAGNVLIVKKAPRGTPIYATGDGKVTVAARNAAGYSGYGVVCRVDHGFGYETLYAHMDELAVKKGQEVRRGDTIGYVGTTGASSGYHLHYEVLVNGKRVNPVYYFFIDISPEEFLEIFEKSQEVNQSLS